MAESEMQDVGAGLPNSPAGAAPDSQRNSRPSSATKQGKESAASQRDREERLRVLKDKQNEERQKKLDELKQQALAAQKFREQKEEERRRRMEELRLRDTDRRHQVEERKRQIWEAERDRREAILRKNQEREARIETKRRNERSSIVFAFGSSTPRMLEPADTGGSYWAARRATSTSNVMMMSMSAAPGPLTRRSSERELDGSKKRATSAGGIDRSKQPGEEVDGEESGSVTPVQVASGRAARRRTDLMPTLPSPRDPTRPMRSPGRAFSMSRLDVLALPRKPRLPTADEQPRDPSLSRSMTHLAQRPLRRGDTSKSMMQLSGQPVPPPRQTRAERLRRKAREQASRAESVPTSPGLRSGEVTPSRPQSSMSQHSVTSSGGIMSSSVHAAFKPRATPRKPRPYSIAITGVTADATPPRHSLSSEHRSAKTPTAASDKDKPPLPKAPPTKKPATPKPEAPKKPMDKIKSTKSSASPTPKATPLQSPGVEAASLSEATTTSSVTTVVTTIATEAVAQETEVVTKTEVTVVVETPVVETPVLETPSEPVEPSTEVAAAKVEPPRPEPLSVPAPQEPPVPVKQEEAIETAKDSLEPASDFAECDMTASMLAKTRITTEEEAKAALAERRRLAREQAEREAELERQRLEVERLAEEQRIREEEEEQRRFEEEQLRLLEEATKAEQERLKQAIEEAQKREEEEKLQKERDEKEKKEKEEAEKKAREEAEKQRQEMEIRLKKEEEDRLERRKRVEAIMSRTRGKGSTPSNTPTKENGDDSPADGGSEHDQFLRSERSHSAANSFSSPITPAAPTPTSTPTPVKQNGHQNGVDNVVEQNNVTNALLDLSLGSVTGVDGMVLLPEQILTPTTATATPTAAVNGKLTNEDSVNFNAPPSTNPFIAFQDNKKQDAVTDLLS